MQLNQRINIKHSQSIVMTPQLRQAIKLLQFSNLELSNYIEEEIEKNPFLESKKQENTFSDNEKAWLKARRIPNTELDSSLGEMIFIDATGKWKTLIGTKCKYGIKFINLPEYSSSLSNHKCDITEKQKKILETK